MHHPSANVISHHAMRLCSDRANATALACRHWLGILLGLAVALPALAANAATTPVAASAAPASAYQCVQNGKTVYQDAPCNNGKAVAAPPPAAPANRAEATARAAREKAQLAKLDAAKARTEALEAKQAQIAARNAQRQQLAKDRRARQCQRAQQQQKWAEQDAAGASAKHLEKARRKALRAQEKAQLLCTGN